MPMQMEGMQELQRKLEQLARLGQRIQEKALKAGAAVLRAEIERRAPKSNYNKEHLIEHIIVSEIVKGVIQIGYEKDFFYAKYLEWGTVNMAAQPFIEPAYLAVKGEVQRVMADTIRNELKRL
ncbi:HK97-gp10 family putative phage morphogenesis protein [Priestia aryabhattai]|uniref:HK97-gp10 family putative phage morphogenesis protein n=1 Tax=Priestia aryabhattai TaxID=412384 RepID=UPI0023AE8C63|nr:HK97-gp10 family putative phage morphogenesis protein [Priestia aryabhattai]MDE8676455.1 HK97 gp10 family phage protein [Priestia aryabhattai]